MAPIPVQPEVLCGLPDTLRDPSLRRRWSAICPEDNVAPLTVASMDQVCQEKLRLAEAVEAILRRLRDLRRRRRLAIESVSQNTVAAIDQEIERCFRQGNGQPMLSVGTGENTAAELALPLRSFAFGASEGLNVRSIPTGMFCAASTLGTRRGRSLSA
jgi:hypothetical protein